MKKYVVKRKTAGLCAVICAGMLLSAGCAGSDANTQAKTGTTEVSSNLENESVTYLSIEADQEEVTKETEMVSPDAAAEGTDADQGEKEAETLDTFTDASDMIESADVSGTAGGCRLYDEYLPLRRRQFIFRGWRQYKDCLCRRGRISKGACEIRRKQLFSERQ